MSYHSFEECTCICHHEEGVYHCMPCCHQCRHCGANIQICFIGEHEKRCAEERMELGLPLDHYGFPGLADFVMKQIDEQIVESPEKDKDKD